MDFCASGRTECLPNRPYGLYTVLGLWIPRFDRADSASSAPSKKNARPSEPVGHECTAKIADRPISIEGTRGTPACLRAIAARSEEHTSELQSRQYLVCRLLLEKKKKISFS